MKRTAPLLIAALAAGPAFGSFLVVDDGFDDGGITNGADPLDVDFLASNAGSGVTLGLVSPGGDNTLSFETISNTREVLAYFDPITLGAVGDFIALSFEIEFTDLANASTRDDFEVALLNSLGTTGNDLSDTNDDIGFGARVNPDDAAGNDGLFFEEGGTNNLGRYDSGGVGVDNPTVNTLTLTRLGASEIQLAFEGPLVGESGNTIIDTENSPITFTFDRLGIGFAGARGAFLLDDVTVTTNVPEPASGLLAMAGAGLLLGRGRRRRG